MNRTKRSQLGQSSCYRAQLVNAALSQLDAAYSNLVEVDADPMITDQLLALQRSVAQEAERLLAPRVEVKPVIFYPKENLCSSY